MNRVVQGAGAARVIRDRGPGRVITGGPGPPGKAAKVAVGFMVSGPIQAHGLVAAMIMVGSGLFTAAASRAQALEPCTGVNTWSATLNGTFADPDIATGPEIAAALFATLVFPAGANPAAINLADGAYADGDILRIWESASPDPTQGNTLVTFSGD